MTYSESIPYMQKAFSMLKKESLLNEDNDEYLKAAMAEDVISRAILRELKRERTDKERTTSIDNQRYKMIKSWFSKGS